VCCWSVGLVQRKIEAAGISTITLSGIPDLTQSVSVPRLAAIEHPLGYLLGQPNDQEVQLAVLRAVLKALERIEKPGTTTHLSFQWPNLEERLKADPPTPSPIGKYLLKHPWHIKNLFSRKVPAEGQRS